MKHKALWRGELVTVVSVKAGKVQIARSCGLRWVKPDELTSPALARLEKICQQRGADYHATLARLRGDM